MKVALDLDNTLAATHLTAAELIGVDYTYDDLESWDWPLEKFGTARALSALWHAWTLRPLSVPPMELNLGETVRTLNEYATVDVVTAHPDHMGISDGKRRWLDLHGIEYDEFVEVPPDTSKAKLDYDVYVDDKPSLPAEVAEINRGAEVYLRDQPYNRYVPGEEAAAGLDATGDLAKYTRIWSVAELLEIPLPVGKP